MALFMTCAAIRQALDFIRSRGIEPHFLEKRQRLPVKESKFGIETILSRAVPFWIYITHPSCNHSLLNLR